MLNGFKDGCCWLLRDGHPRAFELYAPCVSLRSSRPLRFAKEASVV